MNAEQPMNTFSRHQVIRRSFLFTLAMFCSSRSLADSAQFQRGQVAPPLTINPSSPTTSDVIQFTTPLEGNVHSNACEAANALGGYPFLARDDENHIIDLLYDGNLPMACPRIFDPVIGAEGEFGPLSAGDWVLRDPHNNTLAFLVIPEPASALLLLTAGLAQFALRTARDDRSGFASGSLSTQPNWRRRFALNTGSQIRYLHPTVWPIQANLLRIDSGTSSAARISAAASR